MAKAIKKSKTMTEDDNTIYPRGRFKGGENHLRINPAVSFARIKLPVPPRILLSAQSDVLASTSLLVKSTLKWCIIHTAGSRVVEFGAKDGIRTPDTGLG